MLKGTQYIAYTSYSHQPSEQRWRFIVPYAKPVTGAEHEKVYAFMQAQFHGFSMLDARLPISFGTRPPARTTPSPISSSLLGLARPST